MPVSIQKGIPKVVPPTQLTPKIVRDLLLSLPDNERVFIVTDPPIGGRKIYSFRENAGGNLECDRESIPES